MYDVKLFVKSIYFINASSDIALLNGLVENFDLLFRMSNALLMNFINSAGWPALENEVLCLDK